LQRASEERRRAQNITALGKLGGAARGKEATMGYEVESAKAKRKVLVHQKTALNARTTINATRAEHESAERTGLLGAGATSQRRGRSR